MYLYPLSSTAYDELGSVFAASTTLSVCVAASLRPTTVAAPVYRYKYTV